MYGSKIAKEKRDTLLRINKTIENLVSAPAFNDDTKRILKEQRDELNQILRNEAWGALVRARFQHVNEVDICSSYFFNPEKSYSQSKSFSSIRLHSGDLTDDPVQIKKHVREFYQNLYSRPHFDEGAQRQILNDLPRLDSVDSEDLDFPPSIEELDAAVMQLF